MQKDVLEKAIESIKELDGYEIFTVPQQNFIYVVTPDQNVLCIYADTFGGLKASLEYRPGPNTGTGCRCTDGVFFEVTKEYIKYLEKEGLAFANQLGAKFYESPEGFFNRCYFRRLLTKVA